MGLHFDLHDVVYNIPIYLFIIKKRIWLSMWQKQKTKLKKFILSF
jgi:hypothetical protein